MGSAALDLAWLAAGATTRTSSGACKPWDVAAGALLCGRAGLELRTLPPAPPAGSGLLVAPPGMADALLAALAGE